MHNTACTRNQLTLQNPEFGLRLQSFAALWIPQGCLAAGGKRKTLGSFWHTDKGGNEMSWFSRSRGRGGGGEGEEGTEREGDCVQVGCSPLPNTACDEASAAGECGYCSLWIPQAFSCALTVPAWSRWKEVKNSPGVFDYAAQCGFLLSENIIWSGGGKRIRKPSNTNTRHKWSRFNRILQSLPPWTAVSQWLIWARCFDTHFHLPKKNKTKQEVDCRVCAQEETFWCEVIFTLTIRLNIRRIFIIIACKLFDMRCQHVNSFSPLFRLRCSECQSTIKSSPQELHRSFNPALMKQRCNIFCPPPRSHIATQVTCSNGSIRWPNLEGAADYHWTIREYSVTWLQTDTVIVAMLGNS